MKRKLISFLSIFILSAALCGPTFASSERVPGITFVNAETSGKRQRHARFDAKVFVDGLVADNVIPRETGDKLLAYLNQRREEHKAERDKLKAMTEEERQAYFKEQNAKRESNEPFAELVKNGTLTQEQAVAIAKALREHKKK